LAGEDTKTGRPRPAERDRVCAPAAKRRRAPHHPSVRLCAPV